MDCDFQQETSTEVIPRPKHCLFTVRLSCGPKFPLGNGQNGIVSYHQETACILAHYSCIMLHVDDRKDTRRFIISVGFVHMGGSITDELTPVERNVYHPLPCTSVSGRTVYPVFLAAQHVCFPHDITIAGGTIGSSLFYRWR